MAKANTAVPTTNSGIFEGISNIVYSFFVITRLIRSQTEKLETITDISTDAVLHSVQYLDVTTRANLEEAKSRAKV